MTSRQLLLPVPGLDGWHYVSRLIRCRRAGCRSCLVPGGGHGPYWYAWRSVDGRRETLYIGKHLVSAELLSLISPPR